MEERRYYLETWWRDERGMGRRRKIKRRYRKEKIPLRSLCLWKKKEEGE